MSQPQKAPSVTKAMKRGHDPSCIASTKSATDVIFALCSVQTSVASRVVLAESNLKIDRN